MPSSLRCETEVQDGGARVQDGGARVQDGVARVQDGDRMGVQTSDSK